jgi:hypothetical protein
MNTFTIAAAFRLRNKLKERIKTLTTQIERANVTKDYGTAENTAGFDGRTFGQMLELVEKLMGVLRDLNRAIEKANVVNKDDLISLETIKAHIALYTAVADKCRSAEKFRYEYNAEGGHDKIEQEPILNQTAIVAKLEGFKKTKDQIEEKLAEANFKTPVDFDTEAVKKLL